MKFRPLTKLTKLSVLGEAVLLAHWGSRILTVGNCLLFLLRLAQIRLGKRLGKLGQVSRGLTEQSSCFRRVLSFFFSPSCILLFIAQRRRALTCRLRATSSRASKSQTKFGFFPTCAGFSLAPTGQWANETKGDVGLLPTNSGLLR